MPESFDVIVVGGGCNGTGIARDCALRGLSVLLLEKNDFSSGTTGASSGMIHGGSRYLLSDVATTRLSSQDAGTIKKIAPHLCFRIPFVYPQIREKPVWKKRIRLSLMDAYFEAYDRFSKLKGGKRHTTLSADETKELDPSISDNILGSVTFDEWGILTDRLTVANALAVKEMGGTVRNHTEVVGVLKEGSAVVGVLTQNTLTRERREYRSGILFNATGPWVPKLCALAGVSVKLRPAKGIHLVLDRRITNVAVISQTIDGREIFINPCDNRTLLGTTDDDYYGDLDDIPVTEDEVEYLLQGMERAWPEIRKARVISTTRGVRPTLFQYGPDEDDLSRAHKIFDHEKEAGPAGFLSIAGGKLAAYRQMAEEATDLICKKLKSKASCTTHLVPLPGGGEAPSPEEIANRHGIHPYAARRLIQRQGDRATQVLHETDEHPERKGIVCPCDPVLDAEIRYGIRHEWAETLPDIRRRTGFGAGSCQGAQCLVAGLGILNEEKEIDPREELKTFLRGSWKGRAPILKGVQVAEEEILRMYYQGVLGL